MEKIKKGPRLLILVLLVAAAILFLFPVFVILLNSFKGKLYISSDPFAFINSESFVGVQNYLNGIVKTNFISSIAYSLFITIFSVAVIIIFTPMTAWYIARVKNKFTAVLYYLFVFSMIVPFQMVMFPMSKISDMMSLGNPIGIILIYLGFGSGLSVFMFVGFIKSVPVEIEESAMIDGCNPLQTFFIVVFPMIRPTAITVAILNTMWIWNDYLLPLLVLNSDYKTIPIAVQSVLTGSYGGREMGALMAMLVVSIIPIIVFYLTCQKYIIKGIAAGAVKG